MTTVPSEAPDDIRVKLLEDFRDRLISIDRRLVNLETFVNDVRAAMEAMPKLPFVPKFAFRGDAVGVTGKQDARG